MNVFFMEHYRNYKKFEVSYCLCINKNKIGENMGLNEGDSDNFFTKSYAKYTSDSVKAHVGSPLQ